MLGIKRGRELSQIKIIEHKLIKWNTNNILQTYYTYMSYICILASYTYIICLKYVVCFFPSKVQIKHDMREFCNTQKTVPMFKFITINVL